MYLCTWISRNWQTKRKHAKNDRRKIKLREKGEENKKNYVFYINLSHAVCNYIDKSVYYTY